MMITRGLLIACVALCSHTVYSATIVAGWDTWDDPSAPSATVTAAGVTATATASAEGGASNWSIADTGSDPGRGSSDDTTWGTFDGNGVPASAVTNVGEANMTLTNAKTDGEVTITITNNGTLAVVLETFHFDGLAFRPKAARKYALNVLSGDITNGNVFTSDDPMNDNSTNAITHLGGGLSGHDQHDDVDIDLTGLADNTLAAGESAMIQLQFTMGAGDNSGGHHLFLDNVAVSGTIVPEPSTCLLALLSMVSMTAFCRKPTL